MDLMFFYNSFIGKLPEEYEDFRLELKKNVDKIYDTKYVFSNLWSPKLPNKGP